MSTSSPAPDRQYRFSFGPWNLSEGADPFGPPMRAPIALAAKLKMYRPLGFEGVQFHDDDVVPGLAGLAHGEILRRAGEVKRILDGEGLAAEFVAPRLWEDPRMADGAFTAPHPAVRAAALDRAKVCLDIARAVGCDFVVLWLAREGTYVRESKDSRVAVDRLAELLDALLAHDPGIRLAIEPKPNEPVDQAYLPTTGHAVAMALRSRSPERVGVVIESAHAILAGLDPSDEMGFALSFGKLFSVHLNDQNGLKFDQDRAFGAVDLRRAFNQARILDAHGYGRGGEYVGLDVKALRTQPAASAAKHLANSRQTFLDLVAVARSLDPSRIAALVAEGDLEELDTVILRALMGKAGG